jgi:hypothetical protein
VKKACEEYRVILLDQATCYLLCFDHQDFLFRQALQLDMNRQHIERTDLVQHSCMDQMHIPLIDNSVLQQDSIIVLFLCL